MEGTRAWFWPLMLTADVLSFWVFGGAIWQQQIYMQYVVINIQKKEIHCISCVVNLLNRVLQSLLLDRSKSPPSDVLEAAATNRYQ